MTNSNYLWVPAIAGQEHRTCQSLEQQGYLPIAIAADNIPVDRPSRAQRPFDTPQTLIIAKPGKGEVIHRKITPDLAGDALVEELVNHGWTIACAAAHAVVEGVFHVCFIRSGDRESQPILRKTLSLEMMNASQWNEIAQSGWELIAVAPDTRRPRVAQSWWRKSSGENSTLSLYPTILSQEYDNQVDQQLQQGKTIVAAVTPGHRLSACTLILKEAKPVKFRRESVFFGGTRPDVDGWQVVACFADPRKAEILQLLLVHECTVPKVNPREASRVV